MRNLQLVGVYTVLGHELGLDSLGLRQPAAGVLKSWPCQRDVPEENGRLLLHRISPKGA